MMRELLSHPFLAKPVTEQTPLDHMLFEDFPCSKFYAYAMMKN
jgi:hypothetical protein